MRHLVIALLAASMFSHTAEGSVHARASRSAVPLAFVENRGQMDRRVRFSASSEGAFFWFTDREAVFSFTNEHDAVVLRLLFVGANRSPEVIPVERGTGTVNYLIGNDPTKWHQQVPTYREVVYRDLWPGIDLAFRGEDGQLKYEFRVAPGADVADIRLKYSGVVNVVVGRDGDLLLATVRGTISDAKPVSYQLSHGKRVPVDSKYVLDSGGRHGFAVADSYDHRAALIIDPGLAYSTYLGGSGPESFGEISGIAVDAAGNAYVTGRTHSSDFPTTAGALKRFGGGGTNCDAFVTKLNPSGTALIYSTYLGGGLCDAGSGIAVDGQGNAYVTGSTGSSDFPTTAGALDRTLNFGDAFVAKLNPSGSGLLYSTFLGGTEGERGIRIAIDPPGNAYVTGDTSSADFPTTPGAFDRTWHGHDDVYVVKLNPTGSALIYGTLLGGSGPDQPHDLAIDSAGNAYVAGFTNSPDFPTSGAFDTTLNNMDGFVTKLNATGTGLLYSTYLGGSLADSAWGIDVDGGVAYVTGDTTSTDFPVAGPFANTHKGGRDGFVTKLGVTGVPTLSMYLGGSGSDGGRGVAVAASGVIYVTGYTDSYDFPTTADAYDASANGDLDCFVMKLDEAATTPVAYSTYVGGSNQDIPYSGMALDTRGDAYIAGATFSADYPTTLGAFDRTFHGGGGDRFLDNDSFVTKLAMNQPVPASLTLDPAADTNPVDTMHTVTATVNDARGIAVADIAVRFVVSGSVSTSGWCRTSASGACTFSYAGPAFSGSDLISAFADTDGDATADAGEPSAVAAKSWTLPASTSGCKVTLGGHITATNGDHATFGGNANAGVSVRGEQQYTDHGPMTPLEVHATTIAALVCRSTAATVFGQAGTLAFRIDVRDSGEPGSADTYRIRLSNGYDSGEQPLNGGNVQIQER